MLTLRALLVIVGSPAGHNLILASFMWPIPLSAIYYLLPAFSLGLSNQREPRVTHVMNLKFLLIEPSDSGCLLINLI